MTKQKEKTMPNLFTKLVQYEPTNTMISEAQLVYPSLSPETLRAVWQTMWRASLRTNSYTKDDLVDVYNKAYSLGSKNGSDDTARLDWLGNQVVTVRTPLRYGSKECFMGSPDDEEDSASWNIREAIDSIRFKIKGDDSLAKLADALQYGSAAIDFDSKWVTIRRETRDVIVSALREKNADEFEVRKLLAEERANTRRLTKELEAATKQQEHESSVNTSKSCIMSDNRGGDGGYQPRPSAAAARECAPGPE